MKATFGLVVALLLLGGCAWTNAKFNVDYSEAQASQGPLSRIAPRQVKIAEFVDKRPETGKISYKRNGLGWRLGEVHTTKPVPDIVRDALAAEFSKNGHRLTAETGDIVVLGGEVTTFWFDVSMPDVHVASADYVATVAINLNVVSGKTGAPILTRRYEGHAEAPVTAIDTVFGGENAKMRLMNTALEQMVREVSTDPELIMALKEQ